MLARLLGSSLQASGIHIDVIVCPKPILQGGGASYTLAIPSPLVFQRLLGDTIRKLPRAASFPLPGRTNKIQFIKSDSSQSKGPVASPHGHAASDVDGLCFSEPHAWHGTRMNFHETSVKQTHTFLPGSGCLGDMG